MRIAGITIPDNKHLAFALTAVYGVGRARADKILKELSIPARTLAKELSADDELRVRTAVEAFTIEGDLRRQISQDIKRLKDIRSARGVRHERRLPVRGGRTKTNSRTMRGNTRKTMGSGKRKLEKT